MKNLLIIVTNHATLGDTQEANGTYAPELTHALAVFKEAGWSYQIASIAGGSVPIYGEDTEGDSVNQAQLADPDLQNQLQNSLAFDAVNISDYDAIFYPGGFGLLSDLAEHKGFADMAAQHYEGQGVIGAVCHGPAALLPIELSNGALLIQDKSVTAFTREEEVDFGTIDKIPYLLEERLARSAKQYRKGQPWQSLVLTDERLVTGQNPASAGDVAKAMLALL